MERVCQLSISQWSAGWQFIQPTHQTHPSPFSFKLCGPMLRKGFKASISATKWWPILSMAESDPTVFVVKRVVKRGKLVQVSNLILVFHLTLFALHFPWPLIPSASHTFVHSSSFHNLMLLPFYWLQLKHWPSVFHQKDDWPTHTSNFYFHLKNIGCLEINKPKLTYLELQK